MNPFKIYPRQCSEEDLSQDQSGPYVWHRLLSSPRWTMRIMQIEVNQCVVISQTLDLYHCVGVLQSFDGLSRKKEAYTASDVDTAYCVPWPSLGRPSVNHAALEFQPNDAIS